MKTLGALLVTALATVAVTWTAPFQTSAAAGALGVRLGRQRLRRLRVRGLPVDRRLERGTRDGRRDPGALRAGGPRRGMDRGRRQERRPEGRDDVAPDRRRGAARTRRRWSMRRSPAPQSDPVFIPLLQNVQVGERHRLAVLEMNRRPGVWRVWVDGKPMTDPIVLPGSHRIWKPIATAESWNGGVADVQRLRLPLRPGRDRAVAGRLVEDVRARLHVRGPRLRRPAAPPGPARPADARVRPGQGLRVRRGLDRGVKGSGGAGPSGA